MVALLTPFAATSKYCSDCDESLCSDCFSVHGTFKAFISHHVINAQVSADISFEQNKFCSDHKDMISVLESHVTLLLCFSSLTLLAVSIKYLTSNAKSSNMMALLTPFAATSNGFIFPHIRCSSAIHDLQQSLYIASRH
jgi:hypothetical protein